MYILQGGRGGVPAAVLASPFRPIGQERSPKSAPQHVLTVTGQAKRDITKKNVDDNDYFVNLKNN